MPITMQSVAMVEQMIGVRYIERPPENPETTTGDRCGWPVLVPAIRGAEVEVIGKDGQPTTAIYTEDCLLSVDDPDGVR